MLEKVKAKIKKKILSDLISNRAGKKRSSMVRQPERIKSETTVSGNPICLTSVKFEGQAKGEFFFLNNLINSKK